MKKRLLTLALGIATCFTLSAQVLVTSEGEQIKSVSTEEESAGGYSHAADYYGSWNKDSEILGLGLGVNLGKISYMELDSSGKQGMMCCGVFVGNGSECMTEIFL